MRVPARPLLLLLLLLVLPAWAAALDFGFDPPRSVDDPAAAGVMRDLAQRLIPVYQEADADVYLPNLTAMQAVSGAWGAAYDTSQTLRERLQGRPFDGAFGTAIADSIYAHARALEASEKIGFADAYARSFREVVAPLGNARAVGLFARLQTPPAAYRPAVQQAFDRWRAKGSIPQADAVALVRAYLAYESHRSYAVLLPALIAAVAAGGGLDGEAIRNVRVLERFALVEVPDGAAPDTVEVRGRSVALEPIRN